MNISPAQNSLGPLILIFILSSAAGAVCGEV
jgi:hypothetical protein